MDKIQIIKSVVNIILILSAVTLFASLILTVVSKFGGCYIHTEIKNIENPNNLNVEIKTGSCIIENFALINHEEDLTLYAIRGDVISFDDSEEGTVDNVLVCLSDIGSTSLQESRDYFKPVDDYQSCSPINPGVDQEYFINNIQNSWELYTNKGNITGHTEYKPLRINQNAFLTFKISGIVVIISLILSIFLRKKKVRF